MVLIQVRASIISCCAPAIVPHSFATLSCRFRLWRTVCWRYALVAGVPRRAGTADASSECDRLESGSSSMTRKRQGGEALAQIPYESRNSSLWPTSTIADIASATGIESRPSTECSTARSALLCIAVTIHLSTPILGFGRTCIDRHTDSAQRRNKSEPTTVQPLDHVILQF
jgi:hypothetical protein